MSFLDYINPFNKVADLISEVVEDKDKANEIKRALMTAAEDTYRKELDTKTVPWVDALHKMSRPIGTWIGYGLCGYMIHQGVTDPISLGAAIAPGGIYNYIKGRGK